MTSAPVDETNSNSQDRGDGQGANSGDGNLRARRLFIFGEPNGFFEPLVALQQETHALRAPLDAFRQNLASALMVGSIPFQLVHASVMDVRFNQILAAERIRALKSVPGGQTEEARQQAALSTAKLRMAEELADNTIIQRHAQDTLGRLQSHIANPEFFASSKEMLRQVLVMSWGAFETLANDLVRLLLNLRPDLLREGDSPAKLYKEVLTARTLLDGLEKAGFNLACQMGDFLSDLVPLDSLEKIQAAAQAILKCGQLDASLKNPSLRRMAQQRHLIVHRRGVVDVRYRERTGDTTAVGEKLSFDADYVETCMSTVRDIGCLMYKAGCRRLSPTC